MTKESSPNSLSDVMPISSAMKECSFEVTVLTLLFTVYYALSASPLISEHSDADFFFFHFRGVCHKHVSVFESTVICVISSVC